MKILTRLEGFPEGPVVLPDGSIALVEIRLGRIIRVALDGSTSVVATPGGGPNGLALGPGGKLFVCNNGGMRWLRREGEWIPVGHDGDDYTGGRIEVVDLATGTVERLYEHCDGRPLRAPNDMVFDANGNFWFTDPGRVGRFERDQGMVYWARPDGSEIRRVITPLNSPNGIGLSPDGGTLYVADTQSARLWAWEITGPGTVKKWPGVGAGGGWFIGGMADSSWFDSLKVTASGRICVATIGNGGITEFWPDRSAQRHHPLPDAHVTNLAFGGPELRTAYVTCSGHGALAAIPWHEPGLRLHFN